MSAGICSRLTGYHNRRSTRLYGYDYARRGAYFITICLHDRSLGMFGNIVAGKMIINDAGEIVQKCWREISRHFTNVKLDEFMIMPNHIHGIIDIGDVAVGAGFPRPEDIMNSNRGKSDERSFCENRALGRGNRAPTLGTIVAYFKYQTTKQINSARSGKIRRIWQRNYYDHIIRNEKSLNAIRQYIKNNPANWMRDAENHSAHELSGRDAEYQTEPFFGTVTVQKV